MNTTNKPENSATNEMSRVKLKLIDPSGNGIANLKFQIKNAGRIILKGATDAQGNITPFESELGLLLTVHVQRFASEEFKQIKTIIPWAEDFSIKLQSGKIMHEVQLKKDEGDPGQYKRKTYVAKKGDNLEKIAAAQKLSVNAIADLNRLTQDANLSSGQILKLPIDQAAACNALKIENNHAKASAAENPTKATDAKNSLHINNNDENDDSNIAEPSEEEDGELAQETSGNSKTEKSEVIVIKKDDDRGENGTPKSTLSLECDQSSCIKLGAKGSLIEEINIRLMGFGGTISAPHGLDEFTDRTEAAVKQFQRDYMSVAETGKVCGRTLAAIDDFMNKYPIDFKGMACPCGLCKGFGNGFQNAEKVNIFDKKNPKNFAKGIEYPGIHRALIWALRAALFYVDDKDKHLGFSFSHVSSGYRCWHRNKQRGRHTSNHMGNALDLQFKKGKSLCTEAENEEIRQKVFCKRLGGIIDWKKKNMVALESFQQGAKKWVHLDIREFDKQYLTNLYYATNVENSNGMSIVRNAKLEGFLKLLACGGLPLQETPTQTQRLPIDGLSISEQGLQFIMEWEKFSEKLYDDSEGYCTIGWGHLVNGKNSCELLKKNSNQEYLKYKNGITSNDAKKLFANDLKSTSEQIKKLILVPLFQHEFDALMSLAFNTGGLKKFPKLMTNLNTSNYSGCCDEFADITNNGVTGLVKRRLSEMKIFRHNLYDAKH